MSESFKSPYIPNTRGLTILCHSAGLTSNCTSGSVPYMLGKGLNCSIGFESRKSSCIIIISMNII